MNKYYLSHYFKKETGFTLSQYITNQKIMAAKKMLKSGMTVTDVAMRLSYSGDSHFISVFKKMTGITNSNLKNAPSFKEVYEDFLKFIGIKNSIFGTWGTNDLKELHRNILFYNLSLENVPTMYINIQQHASKFFNNPVGKCIGLQNAISILQLEQDKQYHNALNDAYYTALVFQKINNKNIKAETYTYNLSKKEKQKQRLKIDYDNLFAEFKTILKRELSKEDKKIINIAYNMGRKNKFLSNNNKK